MAKSSRRSSPPPESGDIPDLSDDAIPFDEQRTDQAPLGGMAAGHEAERTVLQPVEVVDDFRRQLQDAVDKKILIERLIGRDYARIQSLNDLIVALDGAMKGPISEKLLQDKNIRELLAVNALARVKLVKQALRDNPNEVPLRAIDAVTDESDLRDKVWQCVIKEMKLVSGKKFEKLTGNRLLLGALAGKWKPFAGKDMAGIAGAMREIRSQSESTGDADLADRVNYPYFRVLMSNVELAKNGNLDANRETITRDSGLRAAVIEAEKSFKPGPNKANEAADLARAHGLFFAVNLGDTNPFDGLNPEKIIELISMPGVRSVTVGGKRVTEIIKNLFDIGNTLATRRPVALKDIQALPEDSGLRAAVNDYCRKNGRVMEVAAEPTVVFPVGREPEATVHFDPRQTDAILAAAAAKASRPEVRTPTPSATVLYSMDEVDRNLREAAIKAGAEAEPKVAIRSAREIKPVPKGANLFDLRDAWSPLTMGEANGVLRNAHDIAGIISGLQALDEKYRHVGEITFDGKNGYKLSEVVASLQRIDNEKIPLEDIDIDSPELLAALRSIRSKRG